MPVKTSYLHKLNTLILATLIGSICVSPAFSQVSLGAVESKAIKNTPFYQNFFQSPSIVYSGRHFTITTRRPHFIPQEYRQMAQETGVYAQVRFLTYGARFVCRDGMGNIYPDLTSQFINFESHSVIDAISDNSFLITNFSQLPEETPIGSVCGTEDGRNNYGLYMYNPYEHIR